MTDLPRVAKRAAIVVSDEDKVYLSQILILNKLGITEPINHQRVRMTVKNHAHHHDHGHRRHGHNQI